MCVIAIAEKDRPSPSDVDKMWTANPHGAGAAWVDKGFIVWEKGLTLAEMVRVSQDMPFPFILHFRIPTAGGNGPEMNHPFELGGGTALKGSTKKGVLFHNGHWSEWGMVKAVTQTALHGKMPKGPWSDSRLMAFLSEHGTDWLDELRSQRIVVLDPQKIERFGYWTESTKGSGLWYSNESWRTSFRGSHYTGAYSQRDPWDDEEWTRGEHGIWYQKPRQHRVPAVVTGGTGPALGPAAAGGGTVGAAANGAGAKAETPKEGVTLNSVEGMIREGLDQQGNEVFWIRQPIVGKGGVTKWNRFIKEKNGTLAEANFKACPNGLILSSNMDPMTSAWAKRFATMRADDGAQMYNSRAALGFPNSAEGFRWPATGKQLTLPAPKVIDPDAPEDDDALGQILDEAHQFFGVKQKVGVYPHEGD